MVTKRRRDIDDLVWDDRVHRRVYADPEIFQTRCNVFLSVSVPRSLKSF